MVVAGFATRSALIPILGVQELGVDAVTGQVLENSPD